MDEKIQTDNAPHGAVAPPTAQPETTVKPCARCGKEIVGKRWVQKTGIYCDDCIPYVSLACEVYSRIVGYYRPVNVWNDGKQQEFADRQAFKVPNEITEGRA